LRGRPRGGYKRSRTQKNEGVVMAGRFARSLALARASWSVVRADKELLWLPVLSVLALMLLVGSFVAPAVALGAFDAAAATGNPPVGVALVAFVCYVLAYFVAIFFNTALVGAAMIRMDGGNPTLGDGLAIARSRIGRIFGYAVIAATVGLLLRALEERVGWVGRIVVKLVGVAWTLATFLVVPVLVTRDVGPIDAVKASAELLRETWGENLIGTVGLGLAFAAAYVVVLLAGGGLILVAINAGLPFVAMVALLLAIAALVVLSALQATMQGVYSAALYRHATAPNRPIAGFTPELMAVAFTARG
jgi:Family of unknown function (DUF6159)